MNQISLEPGKNLESVRSGSALAQKKTHLSNTLIALERDVRIAGGQRAFASAGGVITDAATLGIDGPIPAGTNATITNSHGLYVLGTTVQTNTGTTVNADAAYLIAPTIGANNFALRTSGPSNLQGGLQLARTTVATGSSYSVAANDYGILVNKSTGSATTINIPTCTLGGTIDGRILRIADEKGDAGTNNITITPASGTVQNGASLLITANYGRAVLQCDGATGNWVPE